MQANHKVFQVSELFIMCMTTFSTTDINEFYTYTLDDNSKPVEVKTVATYHLAEKWENVSPPVPAGAVSIAKKILDDEVRSLLHTFTHTQHCCIHSATPF